jgi:hypothetical protein
MKLGLVLIFYLIFIGSCTYHNEEDILGTVDCVTIPASFHHQIEPLIKNNCALSGCHIPGGQFPDLTDITQIQDFAGLIKIRTSNRTMPPDNSGKTLSKVEIDQFSCWVDSGALTN